MVLTAQRSETREKEQAAATAIGVLAAYPTLRQAASMIGVSPSALSRHKGLMALRRGSELRIPPVEVMRLVRHYRRRTDYQAGGELIEYATRMAPDYADAVEVDVQAAFRGVPTSPSGPDEFLAEAKRSLPAELYRQILAIYEAGRR